MPLLYGPVASAQPIHIGARDSAGEGYQPDLLQDVPDQRNHMLTSGAHVPGLAAGSDCKIDQSTPSSSPEDSNDEQQRGSLPASARSRWRQGALQSPQLLRGIAGLDTCGHFPDGGLRCITWEKQGVSLDRFFLQRTGDLLFASTRIFCLRMQL